MNQNNNLEIQNALFTVSKLLFFKKMEEFDISKSTVIKFIRLIHHLSYDDAENFLYSKSTKYYKYESKIKTKSDLICFIFSLNNK